MDFLSSPKKTFNYKFVRHVYFSFQRMRAFPWGNFKVGARRILDKIISLYESENTRSWNRNTKFFIISRKKFFEVEAALKIKIKRRKNYHIKVVLKFKMLTLQFILQSTFDLKWIHLASSFIWKLHNVPYWWIFQ